MGIGTGLGSFSSEPTPLPKRDRWSGRRESNPRHQLGRLGFYH
jgi:hypothetical protein